MATTFLGTLISPIFITTLVVVLLLQLQCESRILQDRKNYVTLTTNSILNKALTHLHSHTPTPSPAPSPSPTTSYISSTPDASPAPAPAPADYLGNSYNYKMTSQYSTLDNEEEEEEEEFSTGKETNNFNTYKETTEDEFSNTYSNAKTNRFTSDDDDDGVNNAYWNSNYRGYKSRPQGMSDTRLPGNANLYNGYSMYNENENAHLQHDENYIPTSRGKQVEPRGYYYTDRPRTQHKSRFEFDSMEEYEKQEGIYSDVQNRFFP